MKQESLYVRTMYILKSFKNKKKIVNFNLKEKDFSVEKKKILYREIGTLNVVHNDMLIKLIFLN